MPKDIVRPREAITDAAVRLFSEHGYTGTTMRDIAKAVGLLPGSLYSHIDSKETLLFSIVESGVHSFLDVQQSVAASSEPADRRLRIAVKGHIDVVVADPQRMLIVFHQWRFLTGPNRARAIDMRRQYATMFTDIVQEGIDRGIFQRELDVRIAVFAILGALNWVPEWYSPSGPASPDQLSDRLATMLLRGMLAQDR